MLSHVIICYHMLSHLMTCYHMLSHVIILSLFIYHFFHAEISIASCGQCLWRDGGDGIRRLHRFSHRLGHCLRHAGARRARLELRALRSRRHDDACRGAKCDSSAWLKRCVTGRSESFEDVLE